MMLAEDDVMQAYMDSGLDTDWMLFEMVKFARAVIEANNAKVLADYSADTVSALIQRNEALEAKVKGLEKALSNGVLVNKGALNVVLNALRRDAAEGRLVRAEMAEELLKATP